MDYLTAISVAQDIYEAYNNRIIREYRIRNEVDGRGLGLLCRHLTERRKENHEKYIGIFGQILQFDPPRIRSIHFTIYTEIKKNIVCLI
jgi:hypothetical protein